MGMIAVALRDHSLGQQMVVQWECTMELMMENKKAMRTAVTKDCSMVMRWDQH